MRYIMTNNDGEQLDLTIEDDTTAAAVEARIIEHITADGTLPGEMRPDVEELASILLDGGTYLDPGDETPADRLALKIEPAPEFDARTIFNAPTITE